MTCTMVSGVMPVAANATTNWYFCGVTRVVVGVDVDVVDYYWPWRLPPEIWPRQSPQWLIWSVTRELVVVVVVLVGLDWVLVLLRVLVMMLVVVAAADDDASLLYQP